MAGRRARPIDGRDDVGALREEAAGRRRKLRTAQDECHQFRGRLDAVQRAGVMRLATEQTANPAVMGAPGLSRSNGTYDAAGPSQRHADASD